MLTSNELHTLKQLVQSGRGVGGFLGKSLPFVSRNVISVVENSAVKLMHLCKPLMLLMNCSRLSFVSVHTRNMSSICIFSNAWGGLCFRKDSGFQCAHEYVGVGRCHLCTHGCALFLDVKLIVKSENAFVENEF